MSDCYPSLNPPTRILMGPGPSDIHPRVLNAIGRGTVGHLDPYYLETMNNLPVSYTHLTLPTKA